MITSTEERESKARITPRDIKLFHVLAKLKYLTPKQIGAMFFTEPGRWEWDPKACKAAAATRISRLGPDYLASSYIPGTHGEKCYYLGPEAIRLLKTDAEMIEFRAPRYMERKNVGAIYNSRHDIPINGMLINLMLLEKLTDDFEVRDMLAPGDLRFRVQIKRNYDYKPDAYVRGGCSVARACLFEMDTGAVDGTGIQRKVTLHLEFMCRKMGRLLGIDYSPIMCILMPDMKRLKFVSRQIRTVLRERRERGEFSKLWPFYLATHEELDVRSVENGHVTDRPLRDECWYDGDGDPFHSPFRKGNRD